MKINRSCRYLLTRKTTVLGVTEQCITKFVKQILQKKVLFMIGNALTSIFESLGIFKIQLESFMIISGTLR